MKPVRLLRLFRHKTKILIDYDRCASGKGVEPRDCGKCLQACKPAVFLLHQQMDAEEADPNDPQYWQITPLYPSLCTRCMRCAELCPAHAIKII